MILCFTQAFKIIPENKNDTISETAQDVAFYFNKYFPKDVNNQPDEATRKLRHALIERINMEFPGPGKKPLRDEAISIYENFIESNRIVAKNWFNSEQLFSEDFSMYPKSHPRKRIDHRLINAIISTFADNIKIQ